MNATHTHDIPSPSLCSPSKSPPLDQDDIDSSEPTESSLPSQDPSSSHFEINDVANQSPNTCSTLIIPFHYPSDQLEGNHDGKFFKEHMDSSLDGLLPAFVFHARMKALNGKLRALKPRQFADWMPVVRLAAVGMFACVSAYFLGSSQERRPGLMLWCGSLVGLVAVIFATFRVSSTLEKIMQTSINAFNKQDEQLLIRWRLLPLQAQRHSVFFSWRLVHGCRHSIPWKIQVSHCKKNGNEAVFLPEYTPRFSSAFCCAIVLLKESKWRRPCRWMGD
ncbi:hypothetical protein HDU78_005928 [Chytriomyces hyalinus]|nr:hypothetical protein HDU78_005928 [Chytriomyces hyalinus]